MSIGGSGLSQTADRHDIIAHAFQLRRDGDAEQLRWALGEVAHEIIEGDMDHAAPHLRALSEAAGSVHDRLGLGKAQMTDIGLQWTPVSVSPLVSIPRLSVKVRASKRSLRLLKRVYTGQ
jgi:hypothetical protein